MDFGFQKRLKEDESFPKRRPGSIHRGMSELEIEHRVILTGKIFSIVEAVENRRF
jgi:hypothetical protein